MFIFVRKLEILMLKLANNRGCFTLRSQLPSISASASHKDRESNFFKLCVIANRAPADEPV